jgi:hypothetical protein
MINLIYSNLKKAIRHLGKKEMEFKQLRCAMLLMSVTTWPLCNETQTPKNENWNKYLFEYDNVNYARFNDIINQTIQVIK